MNITIGSIWRRRGGLREDSHDRIVVGRVGNTVAVQCSCGVAEEKAPDELHDDFNRIL